MSRAEAEGLLAGYHESASHYYQELGLRGGQVPWHTVLLAEGLAPLTELDRAMGVAA